MIFGGRLHAIVELLGAVVHAYKAVHEALVESVAWIQVVGFLVRLEPGMIEVRSNAAAGLMEGKNLRAVVVEVGIKTVEGAGGIDLAGEAVDAMMVIGGAAAISCWRMIRGVWGVW